MAIGRFLGGVGALIRYPPTNEYLLLLRSLDKDYAAGVWECVTGRVDQGEGFEDAVRREIQEELQVEANVDFIIGTTHFHRGPARPENELIGVVYACSIDNPAAIKISAEHSQYRWIAAGEIDELLLASDPSTQWIRSVIQRAEAVRSQLPDSLMELYRRNGHELG